MDVPTSDELPITRLVRELIADTVALAKCQIRLARIEAAEQLQREKRSLLLLGAGALLLLPVFILLLAAGVLLLGIALGDRYWASALLLAGVFAIPATIVFFLGWRGRVKQALPVSRSQLREDVSVWKHRPVTVP